MLKIKHQDIFRKLHCIQLTQSLTVKFSKRFFRYLGDKPMMYYSAYFKSHSKTATVQPLGKSQG